MSRAAATLMCFSSLLFSVRCRRRRPQVLLLTVPVSSFCCERRRGRMLFLKSAPSFDASVVCCGQLFLTHHSLLSPSSFRTDVVCCCFMLCQCSSVQVHQKFTPSLLVCSDERGSSRSSIHKDFLVDICWLHPYIFLPQEKNSKVNHVFCFSVSAVPSTSLSINTLYRELVCRIRVIDHAEWRTPLCVLAREWWP